MMPLSGMETPAGAELGYLGQGRRDRRQPLRIDRFCQFHPIPCKASPAKSLSGC